MKYLNYYNESFKSKILNQYSIFKNIDFRKTITQLCFTNDIEVSLLDDNNIKFSKINNLLDDIKRGDIAFVFNDNDEYLYKITLSDNNIYRLPESTITNKILEENQEGLDKGNLKIRKIPFNTLLDYIDSSNNNQTRYINIAFKPSYNFIDYYLYPENGLNPVTLSREDFNKDCSLISAIFLKSSLGDYYLSQLKYNISNVGSSYANMFKFKSSNIRGYNFYDELYLIDNNSYNINSDNFSKSQLISKINSDSSRYAVIISTNGLDKTYTSKRNLRIDQKKNAERLISNDVIRNNNLNNMMLKFLMNTDIENFKKFLNLLLCDDFLILMSSYDKYKVSVFTLLRNIFNLKHNNYDNAKEIAIELKEIIDLKNRLLTRLLDNESDIYFMRYNSDTYFKVKELSKKAFNKLINTFYDNHYDIIDSIILRLENWLKTDVIKRMMNNNIEPTKNDLIRLENLINKI